MQQEVPLSVLPKRRYMAIDRQKPVPLSRQHGERVPKRLRLLSPALPALSRRLQPERRPRTNARGHGSLSKAQDLFDSFVIERHLHSTLPLAPLGSAIRLLAGRLFEAGIEPADELCVRGLKPFAPS